MPDDHSFPVPANDRARGQLIDAIEISDRGKDPFFGHAIASAKRIFDTPVAFLSLISGDIQEFLAIDGADMAETPRSWSMCAYTVAAREAVISPDTHDDPRFRDHPIVVNPPNLRFSASAPVILSNGFCLGTICAVDFEPHDAPDQAQIDQLTDLAAMVARFYELPHLPDPQQLAETQAIASKAQDEFLSLIGHELRTPLNGIVGLSHCLSVPAPEEKEIVGTIRETAEHLNALIESILSFTELSTGDIQLSEGNADLIDILKRAAHGPSRVFRLQGKSIDTNGPTDLPLNCDPALLELALTCLIDNVGKHGGTRSSLSCGLDDAGSVWVQVQDNGGGIAEDRMDAIWHAFAVGDDVHTRAVDGLGLGLPMTRRIVELHGGRLALDQDDSGLIARITLPAWRVADAA